MTLPKKILSESGKAMLSARKVAVRLSCAQDYVGKLCREGKLKGVQVRNAWYVEEDSIAAFEALRTAAREARSKDLSAQRRKETAEFKKVHPTPVFLGTALQRGVALSFGAMLLFVAVVFAGEITSAKGGLFAQRTAGVQTAALAQVESPFFGNHAFSVTVPALPTTSLAKNFISGALSFFFGGSKKPLAVDTTTTKTPAQTTAGSVPATGQTSPSTVLPPSKTSSGTSGSVVQNTYPVIERTIEHTNTVSGITEEYLTMRLSELTNALKSEIFSAVNAVSTSYSSGGPTNNIALTQHIDRLDGVTLSNITIHGVNGLTASDIPVLDYLALSGGTLTGPVDNSSLATSTFMGAIAALSFEATATSTLSGLRLSNLDCSVYGNDGKLTTDALGNIICDDDSGGAGAGTVAGSNTQVQFNDGGNFGADAAFFFTKSLGRLTVTNASTTNLTTTNATTTSLYIASLTGPLQAVGGKVSATSSISDAFIADDITASNYLSLSAWYATTTDALLQGTTNKYYSDTLVNAYVHASSTIAKAYGTNIFTGVNTFNGTFTLGSLNGPLQANDGVVSATTSVGVLYGGTGLAAVPTYGQLLLGNASGGYDLVATSSLGITAGGDLSNYFTLASWYATTTNGLAEGNINRYYTDARVGTYISASSTVPHIGGSAYGDLLYWTGTAWSTIATSSLGIVSGGSYTFEYPLVNTAGNISLAFGTTTSNTWGAHNIFPSLFATNASTTNATTTSLYIASLNGVLQAVNGQVSATSTISPSYGGTGISDPIAGAVLVGSYAGGTWQQLATSSLGLPTFATLGSYALASAVSAYPFALTGNATSTLTQFNGGLTAYASSTIGNGTAAGGLTISGDATTTGLLHVAGTGTSTIASDILISGSIIPSSHVTYSLGDATHAWKDAYIGPGSLYVNGKKVIQDVANVITISTDANQNLSVQTTGSGNINVNPLGSGNLNLESGSGNINVNSTSGNVNVGTTGAGLLSLGTVTAGVWHGTAITAAYGGTGSTTLSGILKGNGTGVVQTAVAGVDYLTSSNLAGYATFGYLFPSNATSTSIAFNAGLSASALTISTLNGPLQANNGVVSATTSVGVLYGGTGLTSVPTYGQLLVGNGTGYTLTATSSLGLITSADLTNYFSLAAWYATTTDGLDEGSNNWYFTDERSDDRVATLLQAGAGVTLNYNDGANTLTISAAGGGGGGSDVNWTYFNGSGLYPSTSTNQVLIGGTSTSSLQWPLAKLGVIGGASIDYASTTAISATNASTTNLTISSVLSGLLKTTATGQVVAATPGTDYLTAASTFAYLFPSDATSTLLTFSGGILATASSTIGNGNQNGGLTINGGATTTGNSLVQGNATTSGAMYIAGVLRVPGSSGIAITDDVGAGAPLLKVGDDTFFTDTDEGNTLGLYGQSDSTVGNLKLGSGGAIITGYSGRLGIGEYTPGSTLSVSGSGTFGTAYDTTAAPANGLLVEGSVGIGTTNPLGKLSVISPDPSTDYLTLDLRNTNGYGIYAQENSITDRGNTLEFMATDYNSGSVTTRNLLTLTPTGNVGIGTSSPYSKLTVWGANSSLFEVVNSASTTIFKIGQAGATTTALAISSITSAILKTDTNGNVIPAVPGTDYLTSATTFAYLFPGNATTTSIAFNGGLSASALTIATLNGPLQANNGVVSATTSVGVLYGGTGLTSVPTYGQLLVGNGTGYTLTATSSLGLLSALTRDWNMVNGYLAPTTTVGVIVAASSTIGNGSQNGGLTINGGATTTGNAYFGGNVGIGTTTPMSAFALNSGQIVVPQSSGAAPSYAFGNSKTSGFYSPAAGDIRLSINSSEKFRIAGTVVFMNGPSTVIGSLSTTPLNMLTVLGTASVGANFNIAAPTNGLIVEGNTGIGTTTPYSRLTTWGTSGLFEAVNSASTTIFKIGQAGATTTALAISSITSAILKTDSNGNVIPAVAGIDYTTFGYLFPSNATSTSIAFNGGLSASALTIATLNGPLQANNGVVSATTSIGVLYGGTGLTSPPSYGNLLVGNASGGYTLTATSSLGLLSSTSIQAAAPLSWNASTGALSIAQATASTDGYLASADFTTFNNKVSTSSLITFNNTFREWSLANGVLVPTSTVGVIVSASSTISGGLTVAGNATSTSAAITSITSALLKTNSLGQLMAAVPGTDYLTTATVPSSFDFATNYGVLTAATSSTIWAQSGLFASSTSRFATLIADNATAAALTIGSLTGPLQAINGAVSASSTLSVAYGGTGANTLADLITLGTHTQGNFLATLTNAGGLTVANSGSENAAVTVALDLAHENTWTAIQSFLNASTTNLSAYTAVFGGTATSTFDVNGALTLAGNYNGPLQANNGLVSATSSIGVKYGGTGLTTAPIYGNILIGDGLGGYTLTSTSSLGLAGAGSQWVTNAADVYYTVGNVGIGTTTPTAKLAIQGGNILHAAAGDPTLANVTASLDLTYTTYVVGKYAYVADFAGGLRIMDISTPQAPVVVGSYTGITGALSVVVAGKYAYVGDNTTGLSIIDVSNAAAPVRVGTVAAGRAYTLALSGKYVYYPDIASGLVKVIDVGDPTNPTVVGSYNTAGEPYGIAVSGKYAFVGDQFNTVIDILDISNPTAPSLMQQYSPSAAPAMMQVSGNYLYVADISSGLNIFDISNPANITSAGTYAGNFYSVQIAGEYAYLGGSSGTVSVVNIHTPSVATLVGTYSVGAIARGMFLSGKYAYVSASENGLQVLDINGVTTPSASIGSLAADTLNVGNNITVGGNIYAQGGLDVGISGIFSRGTIAAYVASSTGINPVVATFMGGNLGIGTTTPGRALAVEGASLLGNTATAGYFVATTTTASQFAYASTTAISSTNASTTNLTISGVLSSLLKTDATGNVVAAVAGTDYLTSATTFSYLFPSNATSTLLAFNGGLTAYASSTIGSGTQAGGLTVNGGATTTGNAYFGGNVGVGTVSPTSALHVVGTLTIDSGGANGATTISRSGSSNTSISGHILSGFSVGVRGNRGNVLGIDRSGANTLYLGIFAGSVEGITVKNDGNVGIGSTSPYAKLGVSGTVVAANFVATTSVASQFPYASTTMLTATTASTTNLTISSVLSSLLKTDATGQVVAAVAGTDYLTAATTFAYLFPSNATSTLLAFNGGLTAYASSTIGDGTQARGLTINGGATTTGNAYFAGNVGIGTATPRYALDITGPGSAGGTLGLLSGSLSENTIIRLGRVANEASIAIAGSANQFNAGSVAGDLNLSGNNILLGTLGASRLYIANGGNIGIGTTTPVAKLHIYDASASKLSIGRSGVPASTLDFEYSTGEAIIGTSASDPLSFKTEGTTRLTIMDNAGSGNVGIGTTSPYQKLSVAGNVIADTFIATSTTATSTFAGGLALETSGLVYDYQTNRVGIGTASPLERFWTDVGTNQNIAFRTAGGRAEIIAANDADSSYVPLSIAANALILNGVSGSGNVAVGTTTPYSKLSIWGTASILEAVNSASTTIFSIGQAGATTTALAISSVTSSLLKTDANGNVIPAVAGTDYLTAATTFAYLFPGNATSTLLAFNGGLTAYASSTIGSGTQAGGLTINGGATTTGNAYFADGSSAAPSISFSGAPTSGIYQSNSGRINIVPEGIPNSLFSFRSSGLDLNSGGAVVARLSSSLALGSSGTLDTYLTRSAANTFRISSDGTTGSANLIVNGNVGIGTTSPASILHVEGASPTVTIRNAGVSQSGTISFLTSAGGNYAGIIANSQSGEIRYAANVAYFPTFYANNTEVMRITATGNVAIGTSTPYSKLTTWGTGSLFEAVNSASSTIFKIGQSGATTTALAISSITSALLKTDALGNVIPAVAGTDYLTAATTFAYLFPSNATSTLLAFNGGLTAYASSTIGNGNQNGGLTINGGATTTGNMYIAGNVGIGTVAPNSAAKMEVVGDSTHGILSSNTTGGVLIGYGNGNTIQGRGANGNTNTDLSLNSIGGNVGVGAASPTFKLDVTGNARFTSLVDAANFVATSTTATSTFAGGLAVETSGLVYDYSTNNVGIGTAAPTSRLDVAGSGTGITFSGGSNNFIRAVDQLYVDIDSDNNSSSFLQFRGNNAGVNILRLEDTGNVGIGTTTPASKLEVNGAIASYTTSPKVMLRPFSDSIASEISFLNSANTTQGFIKYTYTDDSLRFRVAGSELISAVGGNVGIGTTTPGRALSVEGASLLGNSATAGYFVATTTTASQFPYASTTAITATTASTTNLYISGTLSTLLKTNASGQVVAAVAGTDYLTSATTFAYLFPGNATSTLLAFNGGLTAYASSTIGDGTQAGGLTINGGATTTGLLTQGVGTVDIAASNTFFDPITIDNTNPALRLRDGTGDLLLGYDALDFNISTESTVNAFTIKDSGSVGIGTTSPATTFSVNGNGYFTGALGLGAAPSSFKLHVVGDSYLQGTTQSNIFADAANSSYYLDPANSGTSLALAGNVGIGTTSPYARLSVVGQAVAQYFTATSTTNTNTFPLLTATTATTTNLAVTGVTSSLLKTNALGQLVAAVAGTDYASFAYPFINSATSSLLTFSGGLTVSGGSLTLNTSLNGPLQANNGVVSATTSVGVLYGGTGLTATPTYGQLLIGNGTGYTLTATSSLGLANFAYLFPGNATSTLLAFNGGLTAYASSTIGSGTQAGGLTINGGATTTGNAYFAGNLSIASQTTNGILFYDGTKVTSASALTWDGSSVITTGNLQFNGAALKKVSLGSNGSALNITGWNGSADVPLVTISNGLSGYGAAGNVGIGTTTPYSKLSVWGSGSILEAVNSASTTIFKVGQSGATTTALAISSITSSLLKTDANGNVIPAVAGTDYLTSATTFAYLFPSNATSTLLAFNGGLTAYASSTIGDGTQQGGLTINGGATTTKTLTIVSSTAGRYGTIFSDNDLNIAQNTGSISLQTSNNTFYLGGTAHSYINPGSAYNFGVGSTTPWGQLSVTNTHATDPSFVVEDSTSPDSTPFIVDASGNVGVGTSSPSQALSVNGDALFGSTGAIALDDTGSGNGRVMFSQIGTVDFGGSYFAFRNLAGTAEHMRISSNGNVGIGTTSPYAKLSVGGDIVGTNITATGTLQVAGQTTLATSLNGLLKATSGVVSAAIAGTDYINSSFKDWNVVNGYLAPTSTLGIIVAASSTIGNGNQNGGLTVNGGATTTGNGYIGGTLRVGPLALSGTGFIAAQGTLTDTSGTITAVNFQPVWSASADNSGQQRGLGVNNVISGAHNDTLVYSAGFVNDFRITGSIGNAIVGFNGLAMQLSGNSNNFTTVNQAIGAILQPVLSFGNTVTGTITSAVGLKISDSVLTAGQTITGQAGVIIPSLVAGTNNTALLIGQTTIPTGTFGIYNATTSNNYFAGNVGLGTTSPYAKLSVEGSSALGNSATAGYFIATTTTASTFPYASTTMITATTASTTNLTISGVLSSLLKTDASGNVSAAVAGTDYLTSATTFAYLFPSNATSTLLAFNGGLTAYASSTIGDGTQVGGLTVNGGATTTGALTVDVRQNSSLTLPLMINADANASVNAFLVNANSGNGNAASAGFGVGRDASNQFVALQYKDGFSANTSLNSVPNSAVLRAGSSVSGGMIFIDQATSPFIWASGGNAFSNEKMRLSSGGNLGVGTTSPYAKLSVSGFSSGAGIVADALSGFTGNLLDLKVASTTKFSVDQNGALSLGTALTVANGGTGATTFGQGWLYSDGGTGAIAASTSPTVAWLTASSTTATSTFAGGLSVGNGALQYDFSSGVTSIDNLALGALTFDTDGGILSWIDMPVTSNATAGTVESYSAQIDGNPLLTIYSESDGAGGIQNSRVGIASTTPYGLLSVNPNGITGPSFVVGSSTKTDFIVTNAGKVGIGTTSPVQLLSIGGVNPQISFMDSANGRGAFFGINDGFNAVVDSSIGSTILKANGSTYLTVGGGLSNFTGGNVGIGSTTPWGKLSVSGSDTTSPMIVADAKTGFTGNLLDLKVASTTKFSVDQNGAVNISQYGSIKQNGNNLVYASSTNNSLAIGPSAGTRLFIDATATYNVAIGGGSMTNNSLTGDRNNAVGAQSFNALTTGSNNQALGTVALYSLTDGWNNVGIGDGAGYYGQSSDANVFIGYQAGQGQSAHSQDNNVGIGYRSLYKISGTSGSNTVIGYQAGYGITSGSNNIALGAFGTVDIITSGSNNVLIGQDVQNGITATASNQLNIGNLLFGSGLGSGSTLSTGNIGIGTTTPSAKLDVAGQMWIESSSGGALAAAAGKGLKIEYASSLDAGVLQAYDYGASAAKNLLLNSGGGNVGIATSTPYGLLSVNPSGITGPAFVIGSSTKTIFKVDNDGTTSVGDSAGTGDATFQFAADANAWAVGYNTSDKSFRIASSTNFASNVALTITKGTANNVGIASTSPWRTLSVTGTFGLSGSASAESGSDEVLCIDPTTFEVTRGGATCGASSARYKTDIESLNYGLNELRQLHPVSFKWNALSGASDLNKRNVGFIAEEMLGVIPEVVELGTDGQANGIDYDKLTSVLASAVQELDLNLQTIASTSATTTPASQSFAASFMQGVFGRVSAWLADAGNGLANIFAQTITATVVNADTVNTKELCIDGVCITKDQLQNLLNGSGSAPAQNNGGGGSGTPSAPDPEAPVITLNGANPATIAVGTTYNDLGAVVTDNLTQNLGYTVSLNGADYITPDQLIVDTATSTTYIITYKAVDQEGNVGTATRTVVVVDPATLVPPTEPTPEPEPTPVDDGAASSTPDTL